MNICGALVHAASSTVPNVLAELAGFDGMEVHSTGDGGRIVVISEGTSRTPALDTLTRIHRLDGIVAASLVYRHDQRRPLL